MSDLGAVPASSTIPIFFTTHAQTGAGVAPLSAYEAGDVVLYKGSSATQRTSTAGWTMTSPFDSITGLHVLAIDLSDNTDAGFYAAGSFYTAVLNADTETIDGLTTPAVIATFRIVHAEATSGTPSVDVATWNNLATVALPLVPTTAGRTLDVSATGEAGVDWANVGSPTTALDLTNTTIKTTQKVDVDTIKTNPVVNGGTITFPTTATLASTTNITAGTITTATSVTNRVTANADQWAGGTIPAPNTTGVPLVDLKYLLGTIFTEGAAGRLAGGIIKFFNIAAPASTMDALTLVATATTATTATNLTNAPTNGDFTATMKTSIGTAVAASAVASVTAPVTVGTNNDKTGYALTAGERNSIADALLVRDWTAVGATASRSVLNAMRALRNKWSVSAGTLTVTTEDDATSAWTAAVTTAAGNPVDSIDPT